MTLKNLAHGEFYVVVQTAKTLKLKLISSLYNALNLIGSFDPWTFACVTKIRKWDGPMNS